MADSFRSIISLWPSLEGLAEDVGAPVSAVRKWRQRDRIPSEWWASLLSTKVARRAGVSAQKLASLAARVEVRA